MNERVTPRTSRTTPVVLTAVGLIAMVAIITLSYEVLRLRRALAGPLSRSAADVLRVGDPLPSLELVEITGSIATWSLPLPRPLLLYFFTTTCPYCAASRTEVTRLERQLRGTVDTLGIALDGFELAAAAVELAPVPWRIVAPANRNAALAMRVPYVPTVVLVDDGGQVLRVWTGQVTTSVAADIASAAGGLSSSPESHRRGQE